MDLDIFHVDTQGFPQSVVVPHEPVGAEVVRLVDQHPLEFVLVKARVAGAAAVPVAPPVLLPAAVRARPAHLPRPADPQATSGPIMRTSRALMSLPR